MMRAAAIGIVLLPVLTYAEEPPHRTESTPVVDAPAPHIKIVINPEARLSAMPVAALPPPVPCGTAADLSISIVNQGFITAVVEAELVGEVPPGIILDFHPAPLKGVPEEARSLRLTLTTPGPSDLTIAFKVHNISPDLGGRGRIHFLMTCLSGP